MIFHQIKFQHGTMVTPLDNYHCFQEQLPPSLMFCTNFTHSCQAWLYCQNRSFNHWNQFHSMYLDDRFQTNSTKIVISCVFTLNVHDPLKYTLTFRNISLEQFNSRPSSGYWFNGVIALAVLSSCLVVGCYWQFPLCFIWDISVQSDEPVGTHNKFQPSCLLSLSLFFSPLTVLTRCPSSPGKITVCHREGLLHVVTIRYRCNRCQQLSSRLMQIQLLPSIVEEFLHWAAMPQHQA